MFYYDGGLVQFSSVAGASLRVLWPRKVAWILVAALFNSGSSKSISSSSATWQKLFF